jgi:adenosylcobinamide kinase/adenosylcobinamide-phosphate guanylyltransferase
MIETILVIGGCRSGKSGFSLQLGDRMPGRKKIFIATCMPRDEEMKERVLRHKKERDAAWSTLEVPILLPESITENSRKENMVLVDCLTLWISNLLLEAGAPDTIEENILRLTRSLEAARCPVILVSNEVGTGIVPENRLARRFRDAAGLANQKVAACADRVVWMVAGIPVTIKP